jgi:tRNA pseudouridine13 synthase
MHPYVTDDFPAISAAWKQTPDDFLVDEIPAYPPSGDGDHTWLHVEKRDLTTAEAAKRLARALDVDPREVGWAGMKDRVAITTQWLSFPKVAVEKAESVELEDIRVRQVTKHTNKLRNGHLHGNRFELVLRNVATEQHETVRGVVDALTERGLPNYYGDQRFGTDGDNAERALSWILGKTKPPRAPFECKLLVSALQSELFNTVLAERIESGLLSDAVDGDLLRKEDTGGLFTTEDLDDARARVRSWAVSPTGPMFGASMRWPERASKARELAVLERRGLTVEGLSVFKRWGEGTRRPMRTRLAEVAVESVDSTSLRLKFTLPAGSYASVVVREITKTAPEPP